MQLTDFIQPVHNDTRYGDVQFPHTAKPGANSLDLSQSNDNVTVNEQVTELASRIEGEVVPTDPPAAPKLGVPNLNPNLPYIPFHNPINPRFPVSHESARHRMVCDLKATGNYTNCEIAELTSFSNGYIGNILAQPWAQDYIIKSMASTAATERERVYSRICELTETAIEKQAEILQLDICKNAETVRKVTNDILNRAFGTPTQTVQHLDSSENVDSLSDAEIMKRLEEVRARHPSN
jgi:hypothetical protein